MKENIIFLPSKIAPNPMEASYWIDLKEDPTGAVIKVWNGATWKPISGDTEVVAMLQEEIKKKATKATTLSGYGIQDAYTKNEISVMFSNFANAITNLKNEVEISLETSNRSLSKNLIRMTQELENIKKENELLIETEFQKIKKENFKNFL